MTPPVPVRAGHDHAHCNHNHGAEQQLRSLNQHQNNRGSASLAEFQQASRETSQYRAQSEGKATETQRRGESSAQDRVSDRPAAKTRRSTTEQSSYQRPVPQGSKTVSPSSQEPAPRSFTRLFQRTDAEASAMPAQPGQATPESGRGQVKRPSHQAQGTETQRPDPGTKASQGHLANNHPMRGKTPAVNPGVMVSANRTTGSTHQTASGLTQPTGGQGVGRGGNLPQLTVSTGRASVTGNQPTALTLSSQSSQAGRTVGTRGTHAITHKGAPGIFPTLGASGVIPGRNLGFAPGVIPNLKAWAALPLKSSKGSLAAPASLPVPVVPLLGTLPMQRMPGILQRMEHSLMQFSSLLFGNYLKGIPQAKVTTQELLMQHLATLMAAEEKRKKEQKKPTSKKERKNVTNYNRHWSRFDPDRM